MNNEALWETAPDIDHAEGPTEEDYSWYLEHSWIDPMELLDER